MEIDSICTINSQIIDAINQRNLCRYSPSYVARIINRTLGGDVITASNPRYRKGHYSEANTYSAAAGGNFVFILNQSNFTLEGDTPLLGTFGSKDVMYELDKTVLRLDQASHSKTDIYKIAALITLIIGTAHPFPDGNGRTAVGVAKEYIERRITGKVIDFETLIMSNEELKKAMAISSHLLLPGKYNPLNALKAMRAAGLRDKFVKMPDPSKLEQIIPYFDEYKKSIIQFLKAYKINSGDGMDLNIHTQIDKIANLYRKSTKKIR